MGICINKTLTKFYLIDMPNVKGIMMGMIVIVVGLSLVGTIWNAIYDTSGALSTGVNGTTETLLKLVPLIYVGAVIIGGVLLAKYS